VTPGRNVPVAFSPRGDDDEPDLGHPTSNRGSEGGRVADVERDRTGVPRLRRAAVDPVRLTDPVVLLEDPRLRPT
jgi:hypothetical protein